MGAVPPYRTTRERRSFAIRECESGIGIATRDRYAVETEVPVTNAMAELASLGHRAFPMGSTLARAVWGR